ncbi:unnamed protein product [Auanema sp. JU1783]|nr:unnamed protein product [Auanema sp. JU1783]
MYDETACPVDFITEYSNSNLVKGDVDVEEWWRIRDGKLELTWYSPIIWTKKIRLSNIHAIFYMHQKYKPCMKIKGWGMTFSPVWWTCDIARQFRVKTHYNVMIQENEHDIIYKGFTVKNIDFFFEVVKPYLSDSTTIYNAFPF